MFSTAARPPIQPDEAQAAGTSTCVMHKGRISHSPVETDTDGKVFFCPIGRQFWRYTRNRGGMYSPLTYPKSGVR